MNAFLQNTIGDRAYGATSSGSIRFTTLHDMTRRASSSRGTNVPPSAVKYFSASGSGSARIARGRYRPARALAIAAGLPSLP